MCRRPVSRLGLEQVRRQRQSSVGAVAARYTTEVSANRAEDMAGVAFCLRTRVGIGSGSRDRTKLASHWSGAGLRTGRRSWLGAVKRC
jgi:hypothetical protein